MTDVTRCVTEVLWHRNRNEEHTKDLIFYSSHIDNGLMDQRASPTIECSNAHELKLVLN